MTIQLLKFLVPQYTLLMLCLEVLPQLMLPHQSSRLTIKPLSPKQSIVPHHLSPAWTMQVLTWQSSDPVSTLKLSQYCTDQ